MSTVATTLPARGYRVIYRSGALNVCPGCGGSNWHVGRKTAECARCFTALPLKDAQP